MKLLGNILWHFPFFGFLTAFSTFLLGLLLALLVITSPIGLGLIQYSKFLLLPYSFSMVTDPSPQQNKLWQSYSFIVTILYLPLGFFLFLATLFQAIFCFATIICIPVAIPLFKSLGVLLNPVGKICVLSTNNKI